MSKKKKLLQRLKAAASPVVIWGAGYVGTKILDVCQVEGIEVKAFCDRDTHKVGGVLAGLPILFVEDALSRYPDVEIVFAMNRLAEANDDLLNQKHAPGHAGALLFDLNEVLKNPRDSYALPNDIYDLQLCTVVHNIFVEEKRCLLGSLDCVITEKCSLKCYHCSNLMAYYAKPENYNVNEVMNELDTLLKFVDRLFELRLIGGDVFMNKDWDVLLKYALDHPKIDRITFYTNGTIIPQRNKLSLLSNERVLIQISDYGELSRNLDQLIAVCNENQIWHRVTPIDTWTDCSSIHKHHRPTEENDELFRRCCTSNVTTLQKGKLFRCPYAANAFHLGAVVDSSDDYVDILEPELLNDIEATKITIRDYLVLRQAIPICDYCDGRIPGVNEIPPAEQTKEVRTYKRVQK